METLTNPEDRLDVLALNSLPILLDLGGGKDEIVRLDEIATAW